jgi:hypothetical protein
MSTGTTEARPPGAAARFAHARFALPDLSAARIDLAVGASAVTGALAPD